MDLHGSGEVESTLVEGKGKAFLQGQQSSADFQCHLCSPDSRAHIQEWLITWKGPIYILVLQSTGQYSCDAAQVTFCTQPQHLTNASQHAICEYMIYSVF